MKKSTKDHQGAVLYLRVASADQQDQRDGIAEQRAVCTRQAERLGVVVTDEYVDAGASGNNKDRGGLRRLLASVRQRPVRYVIVRDRTRLSRNPADDATIRERIEQDGATIVSAADKRSPR